MPKEGEVDQSYPQKLKEMLGIELLEPFKGAKKHHMMRCGTCSHVWSATPVSKIQSAKKFPGGTGCPKCKKCREDYKYHDKRQGVLQKLKDDNIEVLDEDYKGQRKNAFDKVRVRNTVCGHEFDLCIGNYLYGRYKGNCIICGIKERSQQLTQTVVDRHEEWLRTASEWQVYKYEVEMYTKQSYRKFKDQINPNNLQRGIAGVDGNYHLDHIISRRYCFENNIPAELCGHKDNLQMIGWLENIQKHSRITTVIPKIFSDFIVVDEIDMVLDEDDTVEEISIFSEIGDYGETEA